MIKTYKDWENSLGSYVKQFSPDAWELTMEAFEAGQQSQQAKIDELQKRVDKAIEMMERNKPLQMDYWQALGALNILKGESNDN